MSFWPNTFWPTPAKSYDKPRKALMQADFQAKMSFWPNTFWPTPAKSCNGLKINAFTFWPFWPPIGGKRAGQKAGLSPLPYGATTAGKSPKAPLSLPADSRKATAGRRRGRPRRFEDTACPECGEAALYVRGESRRGHCENIYCVCHACGVVVRFVQAGTGGHWFKVRAAASKGAA